jgi:hypothetical protein
LDGLKSEALRVALGQHDYVHSVVRQGNRLQISYKEYVAKAIIERYAREVLERFGITLRLKTATA